ncbi:ATP-dependent zinc metalloprotease FtsH [Acidiferrobacter sp.]|uniref:ATP-dependent zinc metalloprotease FtsH n=1 Tax=Acidiferrobacter sp. TaxID=1872107 RepID=UPI002603E6AC|nr:ATP-dependent zinc metalloprotease FtsH [Acidiferrobacter sp.]
MNRASFGLNSKKPPDIEVNKPAKPVGFWQRPETNLILYVIFFSLFFLMWQNAANVRNETIPYSRFMQYVEANQVRSAVVSSRLITGTLTLKAPDGKPRRFATVPLENNALAKLMAAHHIPYRVRHASHWLALLLTWVVPFAIMFLIWAWMARRMRGAGSFLNIGDNRVHIHPDTLPKITFDDVAGVEEAKEELKETIEFLKNPMHIQRLGGRMPKGVLLLGSPGTGKTLLARAVAGEANVPFFNISGSEFIEMFVGVGAARVRDLFHQAREKAPCIIFVDELDAIGRARGGPILMGGHDEREQTLNQLLTEMDGFDPSTGVVVMAATNRPEVLDKALLRAGRFDRQIIVDKPDLDARIKILNLHTRKITMAPDVDLAVVAQRTPGLVGADLANIANEAAILAIRHNHDSVLMADFEEAIDRVMAGPEKKHRVLGAEEKRRVAFHESGHALTAASVPTGEPVHKISIIPRGVAALGYTMQLPVTEKFLATEDELRDQIAILLGGRSAEELVFGSISSGASNDLERATEIARDMVTRLGMSPTLGPLTYGRRQQSLYLGGEYTEEANYSEQTAQEIDTAVRALVEDGYRRARAILEVNRTALERLATALEAREVISGDEMRQIVGALVPSPAANT